MLIIYWFIFDRFFTFWIWATFLNYNPLFGSKPLLEYDPTFLGLSPLFTPNPLPFLPSPCYLALFFLSSTIILFLRYFFFLLYCISNGIFILIFLSYEKGQLSNSFKILQCISLPSIYFLLSTTYHSLNTFKHLWEDVECWIYNWMPFAVFWMGVRLHCPCNTGI